MNPEGPEAGEETGGRWVPPSVIAQTEAIIDLHPNCFWFRHPEARIRTIEDVQLVVRRLREYGDQRAWYDAQELQRCLSQLSSTTS